MDLSLDGVSEVASMPSIQHILQIIRKTTGVGFAAVARVTPSQWIACAVDDGIGFGLLPGGQLVLEATICNEVRQHQQPVIIDKVSLDKHYRQHAGLKQLGIERYISMPIILNDTTVFGTLCALDRNATEPAQPYISDMFSLFAQLIADHLDKFYEAKHTSSRLSAETQTALLREEFIAVMGHDLRSPLTVCITGAEAIMESKDPSDNKALAQLIFNASQRMKLMLDNIMDFSQGKSASGLSVYKTLTQDLDKDLIELIEGQISVHRSFQIRYEIDIPKPINLDSRRIQQVLGNLLSNATSYASPGTPILIKIWVAENNFNLSVSNHSVISSSTNLANFFIPYQRGNGEKNRGLGLGLFIVSQIAIGHGGNVTTYFKDEILEFRVTIPV